MPGLIGHPVNNRPAKPGAKRLDPGAIKPVPDPDRVPGMTTKGAGVTARSSCPAWSGIQWKKRLAKAEAKPLDPGASPGWRKWRPGWR